MWLDHFDDPTEVFATALSFDCETTIRNLDIGKLQASPFHPANKMVCFGCKTLDAEPVVLRPEHADFPTIIRENGVLLLVGQNIKFDLLWMMRTYPDFRDMLPNLCIWDTQLAEYLLTGQDHKMASLNELAMKYGGTLKDDRIAEFWKAGVDTSDIPFPMLEEYQKYDVINTEIVFLEQVDQIIKEGLLNLTMTQMDALMATTEMEWHGMKFDKDLALELAKPLQAEIEDIKGAVSSVMEAVGFPKDSINVGSNSQISALIFGGEVKYKEKDYIYNDDGTIATFKGGARAGQPKTKIFERSKRIEGLCKPISPKGKNGSYPVGDDSLSKVKAKYKGDAVVEQLVGDILKFRQLEKDVNTYYIGYASQVFPDGCLHGNYNHTKTGTGRLSSSSPNLQNISN
ncbi:putative DNA polymerase [Vibrio phage MJW]